MDSLLNVRATSTIGLAWLAMLVVGLVPLLTAGPSSGAGLTNKTPEVVVNRSLKGDRLPVATHASLKSPVISAAVQPNKPQSPSIVQRSQIPVGCEAAFSPVSSPRLAYIYRRCMT